MNSIRATSAFTGHELARARCWSNEPKTCCAHDYRRRHGSALRAPRGYADGCMICAHRHALPVCASVLSRQSEWYQSCRLWIKEPAASFQSRGLVMRLRSSRSLRFAVEAILQPLPSGSLVELTCDSLSHQARDRGAGARALWAGHPSQMPSSHLLRSICGVVDNFPATVLYALSKVATAH